MKMIHNSLWEIFKAVFKEKLVAPNTFITKNKRKINISVRTLHKGEIKKPEKEKIDQKTESNENKKWFK